MLTPFHLDLEVTWCWILCCFTGAWKGRIGLGPVILARKSDFSHELDTNLKVFFSQTRP